MTITFTFTVASSHVVTIQWYKDGVALVDGTYDGVVISGVDTNTLTITDPTAAWNGSYYATIYDATAVCTVTTDPVEVGVPGTCTLIITLQPDSEELDVGDTLELEVAITGAQGTPTYQWYLDGVALVDGASGDATISGATTASLTVTNITEALAGDYTVVIIDPFIADCSVTSDAATVAVSPLPITPPEGMYIWYDASQETSFSDGDVALPLEDFSGNGYDAVNNSQPSPIQPIWVENELSNLPVFSWRAPAGTGNDTAADYTDPFILGVVPTGYTFAIVINRKSDSVHFDSLAVAQLSNSFFSKFYLHSDTSPTECVYTHIGYSTSAVAPAVPLNSWQIITGTFDFVEGVPRIRTNDAEIVGSVGAGTLSLNIAQLQGASFTDVAEVLYYPTKLSDLDLAQLRTYLSDKWGIAITV